MFTLLFFSVFTGLATAIWLSSSRWPQNPHITLPTVYVWSHLCYATILWVDSDWEDGQCNREVWHLSLNWNVVFAQWNPVLRQSVYFTKSVSLIKQLHCSSLHCQLSKSSESLVLENHFPKQNKNINECINIKVQRNIKT